jgi:Xaa-Pro aminopeptidase
MIFKQSEFTKRRQHLMEMMAKDSIAVIPSSAVKVRNKDVDYQFRQDSDFSYLSGFEEPDAVLVLVPGREHGASILFCRERNPEMEMWNGDILGPENALTTLKMDDAFPVGDIDDILPGLLEGRKKVFYSMGRDSRFDAQVMEWVNAIKSKVRSGAQPPGEFVSLDHYLHELRLYKSASEIKVMSKAAEISAQAHIRAMKYCRPGRFEYQLEAEIIHHFMQSGSRYPAYPSIVGGGKNACILHYVENKAELKEGDLVLIDAGCEIDNYASDITRTFPVNGKFSTEQKAVYDVVLNAQLAAIAEVKPGKHWNHPHEAALRVITEGLVELGLLKGDVDQLIADESYKVFFMHRTGHWLGMDVHDVGDYKVGDEWRVLEPGMVLTVEPGIYISNDNKQVAKRWRGIGIRIEDDVVVTRQGCKVISASVPKTTEEIEKLMSDAEELRGVA